MAMNSISSCHARRLLKTTVALRLVKIARSISEVKSISDTTLNSRTHGKALIFKDMFAVTLLILLVGIQETSVSLLLCFDLSLVHIIKLLWEGLHNLGAV